MQFVAISLVVVSTVASLGVGLWIWLAMDSIGEDLNDFAGFDKLHFQDRSDRS
jgi:hypothetical protein